ncbi:UDP-Glc:alpha-D-GlcNAc-diphosphoundecaprenol beta-1,3-glucosyltransferase WfaP [Pseudoruegeria aquimaris]|uniref:UDP-Glc:alpha-D-GlcNAc-diphosphoundecaprenol beta-1,3-glucosyltransferase WfaP n=1 Tax=Pseudoruegeria aquimaris TaxID=393663 RepID=A0A1Y5T566_9RHOB|nr:glycosyltransferase family 2 protein [Pseudoruegeria aquimaris]SLN56122.1 UDP-Glc:alpha-D-GlcNAc-diphosphoundecaprenol beta-1,3-glucosyltransferase WfaP [Pseudoruegeria aquimaris]
MGEITIVIATYNRPKVLQRVLRTVRAQTVQDWEALIIGDGCDAETGEMIAAFRDPRLRYVNLPERFGEQAGPNSVGMALAQTPYVTFLNHDDYWLETHLESCLDGLKGGEAPFYWSRAAFFTNRGAAPERTFFLELSPPGRTFADLHTHKFFVAEPLSSWAARRSALEALGPWKLASQTGLTPIAEFAMRAARHGYEVANGAEITVLKDNMHVPPPIYADPADYAERWVRMIEAGQGDAIRAEIREDIWLSEALELHRRPAIERGDGARVDPLRADRQTGINLRDLEERARGRAPALLNRTLENRTGKALARQPDLAEMIRFAKGALG